MKKTNTFKSHRAKQKLIIRTDTNQHHSSARSEVLHLPVTEKETKPQILLYDDVWSVLLIKWIKAKTNQQMKQKVIRVTTHHSCKRRNKIKMKKTNTFKSIASSKTKTHYSDRHRPTSFISPLRGFASSCYEKETKPRVTNAEWCLISFATIKRIKAKESANETKNNQSDDTSQL